MSALAGSVSACRAGAPLRARRAAPAIAGSAAPRRALAAAGRAVAGLRVGSGSSELVALRFGTAAFGAGGAALRASVPQAAAGASGARGGALVRAPGGGAPRTLRLWRALRRALARATRRSRARRAAQATEMNLFERAVRVMKSYANALVTSAEARCARRIGAQTATDARCAAR
jgi:hypothetical protein